MRKFKQLLLLVISITLVGCHTTGSIKQKAWKVQQGMTTEEIGQLLGKPDFRRFDGSLEQWEYQSGGIATSCKFLLSISRILPISLLLAKVKDLPFLPARPVLPIRCT